MAICISIFVTHWDPSIRMNCLLISIRVADSQPMRCGVWRWSRSSSLGRISLIDKLLMPCAAARCSSSRGKSVGVSVTLALNFQDKAWCQALLIEANSSTDFAVEKVDVYTGTSENDNRISFAEVIS